MDDQGHDRDEMVSPRDPPPPPPEDHEHGPDEVHLNLDQRSQPRTQAPLPSPAVAISQQSSVNMRSIVENPDSEQRVGGSDDVKIMATTRAALAVDANSGSSNNGSASNPNSTDKSPSKAESRTLNVAPTESSPASRTSSIGEAKNNTLRGAKTKVTCVP